MTAPVHWHIITGCSLASTGCANCHAIGIARALREHPSRAGLTDGPRWTGEVRFNEAWLNDPLAYSNPLEIAIATQSDLFHEKVPDAWLDQIFDVIDRTPQHRYQVLTKRPAHMREYVSRRTNGRPIPNVAFGVSAEREEEARQRIPDLLATPAAARFVVFYPLLAEIDLTSVLGPDYRHGEIAVAAIGTESQRPAPQDWIDGLAAQSLRLGMMVTEARPNA